MKRTSATEQDGAARWTLARVAEVVAVATVGSIAVGLVLFDVMGLIMMLTWMARIFYAFMLGHGPGDAP